MCIAIDKLQKTMTEKKLALRKRRVAMRAHREKLAAIFTDVEALGCDPYTDGDWIFVPLMGDKHKFLAFARLIAKHGFKMPKVEKGATGFTCLHYIGDDLPIYFQFSSTVCRRVKVGTKTVEQDVFETVCDELMPYGDPSPAPAPVADDIPF